MAENRPSLQRSSDVGGALVAGDIGRIPGGDHRGERVGGGEHLDAERPHQVERAAVDAADVWDGVAWRVLHQDTPRTAQSSPSAWTSSSRPP